MRALSRTSLCVLTLSVALLVPAAAAAQGWTLIPKNRPARASEDLSLRELSALYAPVMPALARCFLDEVTDEGPPAWLPELSRIRLRFRDGQLYDADLSRRVDASDRLRSCVDSVPATSPAPEVRVSVEIVQVFQLALSPVDLSATAMRCTGPECVEPPPDTPGRLSFGSDPWCEVEVDGEAVGQTPVVELELPPGTHHVRCRNPDGVERELDVEVRPGRTARRTVRLEAE